MSCKTVQISQTTSNMTCVCVIAIILRSGANAMIIDFVYIYAVVDESAHELEQSHKLAMDR